MASGSIPLVPTQGIQMKIKDVPLGAVFHNKHGVGCLLYFRADIRFANRCMYKSLGWQPNDFTSMRRNQRSCCVIVFGFAGGWRSVNENQDVSVLEPTEAQQYYAIQYAKFRNHASVM